MAVSWEDMSWVVVRQSMAQWAVIEAIRDGCKWYRMGEAGDSWLKWEGEGTLNIRIWHSRIPKRFLGEEKAPVVDRMKEKVRIFAFFVSHS